jgi:hypothetical protein
MFKTGHPVRNPARRGHLQATALLLNVRQIAGVPRARSCCSTLHPTRATDERSTVEVEGRLSERKSAGDRLTSNSTKIWIRPKPDRRRPAQAEPIPSESSGAPQTVDATEKEESE